VNRVCPWAWHLQSSFKIVSERQGTDPLAWSDADARLAALNEYRILGTAAEQSFEDLTLLAARICEAPVALVSLIDRDRHWFKAPIGFPDCETDLDRSVCRLVLDEPDVLVIPDLALDPRTKANPSVTGEPLIRFYAGAPLRTPEGMTIGGLCVIDIKPRPAGLTEIQQETLRALARQLTMLLDLRRKSAELTRSATATATAVSESETRFRNMADNAPVMMWVTDPSGFCTYLNARWYEFTGQTLREGEGYGWLDAVHPDDRRTAEAAFVSANAERRDYRVDFRLRRADGVYRWTIDAAAARFSPDGEFLGYVGSVIDIDERREAEERLAFNEEQLRLAIEVGEIGQWDVDHLTGAMFWPPRVKAMFGISPDVPVTLEDFHKGVHPDDQGKTRAAYEAASDPDRRPLYDVEYRTIGKEDGVVRWVAAKGRGIFDAAGRCVRVIGTAIDATTRKASEARLHELNERLEQKVAEQTAERNRVWEMSRDLFAVMGFDGHLKAINPAWETTLGRDAATLLSLPFPEQVHPDDHESVRAVIELLLRGESVARFEDRLRHADGSWRWISWALVPEGDVFYAVGRDVTAEKEAAAELMAAQEALRQSQKMEAVGQLTGGLAHDFNNLLAGISGSLELMQARMQQGRLNEIERYMAVAQGASKRAAALTHRLLAFSRRQTLDPKPTDVNRLVNGMQDMIQRTVGPGILVEAVGATSLWPALVDPSQLENALLNLCINARDAMPDGGRITIETANKWMDEWAARQHNMSEGQYLSMCVTDTGTGMPPEVVARVFEPFFTTKPIGEGTGLGLSMIYGFAQQSGGQVRIYSEVGKGTTVCIYLPRHYGDISVDDPNAKLTVLPRSDQGETVLVVDDEPSVRMIVTDILEDLGYTAIEAGDSAAGLKVLQSNVRIDLLITDVGLPGGMNGRQMADAARVSRPSLKVLFITGYAENAILGNGHLAPGMAVLTKPFPIETMAARILSMIEGGKVSN
jgi:PAS domain S-box-containing protein